MIGNSVLRVLLLGTVVDLGIGRAGQLYPVLGLPHGIEVLIGQLLISRNLGGSASVDIGIARTRPHQEVGSGATLDLGPTLEGVAVAGLGTKNINSLVDLDAGVRAIQRTFAVVIGAVVAVPVDVRQSRFLDVPVDGLQLDGVGVLAGLDNVIGCDIGLRVRVLNPRIALKDGEGAASRNLGSEEISVLRAVPRLKHPVVEDLASRSGRRCACGHAGVVLVKGGIRRSIGAAVGIVEHTDAISADGNSTPLSIEIEFLGNPEAVDVGVGRCTVAPPVHGVG